MDAANIWNAKALADRISWPSSANTPVQSTLF